MSDRAPSPMPAPTPTPQQTLEAAVQVKEESPSPRSPTGAVALPPSSPTQLARRTERCAYLRNDPLSGEVEPHRVYCQGCKKWIKLAVQSDYCLANWKTHRQRCPTSPSSTRSGRRTPSFHPNSRVAIAERKIVLLNDLQVKTFSTRHVECHGCKTLVALEGEVDYDLTKWTEHKEQCTPVTPAPITPQESKRHANPPPSMSSTHSRVSAGRSAQSLTPAGEGASSNSTETTAVCESSPAAVTVGVKRSRDEDAEEEDKVAEEVRPANRPRTETYEPPEKDAPGVLGWLIQPLREFARGFREGLGTT